MSHRNMYIITQFNKKMPARLHSLFSYIRNVELSSGGRGVKASFSVSGGKRTQYREFAVSRLECIAFTKFLTIPSLICRGGRIAFLMSTKV